ncbi:STY0301 family protein [Janthinobacterium sp. BJB426]|uniref:STY0301 family protein n=1 Tax=Janthinobacterium sp. BJB426 TaxID=2048010 RepID=UPI000C122E7B|nr:STY0301 family protein [Janthinobacterium sp. BJB426]
MKPLALLAFSIAGMAMPYAAAAPVVSVSCPQAAPSTWNLPAARLDSVRVLSYPANHPPVDGEALPILAPIREWTSAGTLYQRWDINFDAPRYLFQVDCLYATTERYLRMDLPGVKQCVATVKQRTKIVRFQCK